ncbi:hypothetical protein M5J20_08665 [Corynebacterium sp. TA-R-1]|uniref:DUF6779 domain-containing protein n=1 Tax=Corynebacterium stercoris TaxID=2943490 RepID=A0ABT1G2K5_9CORY|nr:DUF6779 domain-containing protein [Corynebacterium stercoris]MCP1388254.1 hypothetical protein [Corynebacterium stercoris]
MTDREPTSATSSKGTFWVVAPFVVAVIGTVVMLFTNSANALKIALIFALWAAVAGIMVIDRTRRDRDTAVQRAADTEAQLADARSQLAKHPDTPAPAAPAVDVEVLRELQAEIKALRSQLEELRGEPLQYEPAAVHAAARRIQEIESTPKQPGPSTEDTAKIAAVKEPPASRRQRPGAPTADAISGRLGQQPSRPQPNPLAALISEREREAAAAPKPTAKPAPTATPKPKPTAAPKPTPAAPKPTTPKPEQPKPFPTPAAPKPQPTPPAEPAPAATPKPAEPTPSAAPADTTEPTTSRRGGRRRRDERGASAISVADLLKREEH